MAMDFRTYLRALEPEDYRITGPWHNDHEVMDTVTGPERFVSLEYEKKWVNDAIFDQDNFRLMVCLKEDSRPIGIVSLTGIDWINRSASVGCIIADPSLRGKGYGMEATLLLLKFGFHERNLHRISASFLEDNISSRKVLKKCGFREEGLLKEAVYKNGRFHNLVSLAILDNEFSDLMEKHNE
jgi:RimJ/RimL family protein N-acetyltransferase